MTDIIVWTSKSIRTVNKIMNYINNTKLMKSIGYIIRYYINKNAPNDKDKIISTLDNIEISRDTIILAYVCEICIRNSNPEIKIINSKSLIYKSIGKIINNVTSQIFSYKNWSLNYEEMYLFNLISEFFDDNIKQNTKEIIKSSYFVTKYLISLDNEVLYNITSLISHAEDLDLNIFPIKIRREIMNILRTKRTLHLRIFCVISYHMIQEKSMITSEWTESKMKLDNMEEFKECLSNDIIQLIISITGYNISSLEDLN